MSTAPKPPMKKPDGPAPGGSPAAGKPSGNPGKSGGGGRSSNPLGRDRVASIDAYRGFVMLAMVSSGLGIPAVAKSFPESGFWQTAAYQMSHVRWTGCSFWDLIMPSFCFLVGVSMPYSLAARQAKGEPFRRSLIHAAIRALVLVLLGVFLYSKGFSGTYWIFINVLAQIGLGYFFVFLLAGQRWWIQALAAFGILLATWLLFWLYPATQPTPGLDRAAVELEADWPLFTGLGAHWNKHLNVAAAFDQWFLNLLPRGDGQPFTFTRGGGGYQTLNFLPTIATMILGVLAGMWLRAPRKPWIRLSGLAGAGVACLLVGALVDHTIWPAWLPAAEVPTNAAALDDPGVPPPPPPLGPAPGPFDPAGGPFQPAGGVAPPPAAGGNYAPLAATVPAGNSAPRVTAASTAALGDPRLTYLGLDVPFLSRQWSVCPIVKKLWTPTWVVFSAGWSLLLLALFYGLIDVRGWQAWSFPLSVVGVNSIAIYMVHSTSRAWIESSLAQHVSAYLFDPKSQFTYSPIARSLGVMLVLWLMCYWFYRQRIFFKI